jgi:hypothetical protein
MKPHSDPFLDWCENNQEKLQSYPNSYVGIDINLGKVIVSAVDETDFIRKLKELGDYGTRLYTIHTSPPGY